MVPLKRCDMSFNVNQYVYSTPLIGNFSACPSPTEQGQGKTVRQVLTEFSRSGSFDIRRNNRFTYADSFKDDEPLDSERLENLIEAPDLSQLDQFELHDLIMDNLEEVSKEKVKKEDSPEPEPTPEES